MKTTLGEIFKHNPCNREPNESRKSGWNKGVDSLLKNDIPIDMSTEVTLEQIYKSNGIKDAIWCLRCFNYKDYCLFLADIAESVYPIYKKHNPHDWEVWSCIQSIHYYYHGLITEKQLSDAAYAAYNAYAVYAASDAAYAAYAVAGADAGVVDFAAYDAAFAAYDAAFAAYAAYAAYAAANFDFAAYAAAFVRKEKWKEIEHLFIKHFCTEE